MAKVSEEDVEKIAELAHLKISSREKQQFTAQLDEILAYAERIQSIDTEGVEPTSHALARGNVFREDVETACLPRDAVLEMAPENGEGLIKVPKVIP
jgi:aspartyl-tRNA(Asn)/glutamyl-tRNA(Gln) amidotransferase subunit C